MGEQHLAEKPRQLFAAAQGGEAHVLQRQPLHVEPRHIALDADERRARGLQGKAELLRKAEPVAAAARGGVRQPARADDDRVCLYLAFIGNYVKHSTLQTLDLFHLFIERKGDAAPSAIVFQTFGDVARLVGGGKDAVPPFHFQRQAALFEQLHQPGRREGPDAAV